MAKKIAIVGAGWMAAYHVAGFRAAGADVVAIVDKNAAAAERRVAEVRRGQDLRRNEGPVWRHQGSRRRFHHHSQRLSSSPGHGGVGRRQARLLREASGPQRRRSRTDGRGRQEGRHDADVQLQQPRPSRVLCDEGVSPQRRGRPRQFGSGQLDPQERHPRDSAAGSRPKSFPEAARSSICSTWSISALHFMGYPEPQFVLGQTVQRFHRQRGVQGALGHSGRNGRRNRRRSVGPCLRDIQVRPGAFRPQLLGRDE